MNRREFSLLVVGAAATWSQRAFAQQQTAAPGTRRLAWIGLRGTKNRFSNQDCRSSIRITIYGSGPDGDTCWMTC